MTVESAVFISQLNTALPSSSDPKSEGDDHVRLLKSALKATFPNFGAAALAASNAQLDKVVTTFSVASAPAGAVTVDGSGNVGVGTGTIPAGRRLVVTGGAIRLDADTNLEFGGASAGLYGNSASNYLVLFTSTTERMRIDPSGNLIKTVNTSAPALSANQTMVVSLPSDTQLRFSVRGSDGVTRAATLTLA